jgi:arylsulfatase A-like enzyme
MMLMIAFFAHCDKSGRKQTDNPNIIIITIDTLRADHLSTYGYEYQTSPNIDAFAEQSLLFEFAYCPVPKTSASFASLMTGLHPFVHKTKPIMGPLDPRHITLAEILKMKGYQNFAVVDNTNLAKKYNFDQGFDEYIEVWDKIEEKKESTRFITKTIMDFLEEKKNKPFFLWANYLETHTPYIPPEKFVEKRPEGRDLKKVKNKFIGTGNIKLDKKSNEGYFLSLYDGAIKYIDSEMGKIFNLIYKKGYHKNSIIIFSADHGEALGEHNYYYSHGPLTFNASARVPLIIRLPEGKGRRLDYPVSLMDIYPTILDKVGLSPPYDIQGIPLFKKSQNRMIFIYGCNKSRAVVHQKYHSVKVTPAFSKRLNINSQYLFIDLKDPLQKENLYKEKKKLFDFMDAEYNKFYKKYGYLDSEQNETSKLSQKEIEALKSLGYLR